MRSKANPGQMFAFAEPEHIAVDRGPPPRSRDRCAGWRRLWISRPVSGAAKHSRHRVYSRGVHGTSGRRERRCCASDIDCCRSKIMKMTSKIRNLSVVAEAREAGTRTLSVLVASVALVSLPHSRLRYPNVMLVSVTERTREIGVRMAVGARSVHVAARALGTTQAGVIRVSVE